MVRAVLLEVCEPQEAHNRLVLAEGEHNIIVYEDHIHIVGRNPIWVQTTLMVVIRMFVSVGLITNIGNTKAMVSTPGFVWIQQGTVAYKSRATGEGAMFWEWKKTRGICE